MASNGDKKKGDGELDEYYKAAGLLPAWLAKPLMELPQETAERIHEIRMRVGGGLWLTIDGRQLRISELASCPEELSEIKLTQGQMDEILYTLCGGSVHAHQDELAAGYIAAPHGCRVGVGGRYLRHPERGVILQKAGSLNMRIAREKRISLPQELREALSGRFTGLLIAGEPDSGKTTLLREAARFLASGGAAVTVVDERRELFLDNAEARSVSVDTVSGLPKGLALQMALRAMSPRVIVLDELGGMDEAKELEQGFFSGVDFVASVHASSVDEAVSRPQVRYLKERGMLRAIAALKGRAAPGIVKEVRAL